MNYKNQKTDFLNKGTKEKIKKLQICKKKRKK